MTGKYQRTWEELKNIKEGTIIHDEILEGIRFIIIRGPASLCAYLGVPLDHPLAGFCYEEISLQVHGGLTFSGEADGLRPNNYYWYGWDYGHAGDWSFYSDEFYEKYPTFLQNEKKWLVEDVIEDSWWSIEQFKKLHNLAEQISRKRRENG